MSGYIELEWPTLCAEVLRWSLTLPKAALSSQTRSAPAAASFDGGTLAVEHSADIEIDAQLVGTDCRPDKKENPLISQGVFWRSGRDSNPRPPA
jgi:hypothetical protein